mmetsp:Transcript_8305/g.10895  ORF Transcript_8305/g.10895 Transcript_8305/m.10895 type:complete len:84 (-) Transcript_8305:549-800(-)|eukprot:CAMPEP_0176371746 /NCGR_PEP_ID=MMETSP0126-20121128/24917_1 /TAXON_ID=141414 ORGANISM="Strombidinopsis acuminatum, Strain SPMC142" /NCGR_SAMPLE_ID=MMETSP0126 /ASSEMBLY_ACC=CAM_ASM_000229 /LENGTH=83 /DNA_ID=CAMNT_0017731333 /DNA_START=157 /DNA_END=408 /DNA_ORIENTATION=+
MDTSHVALVALNLSKDGFDTFQASGNMCLGVNINTLAKIMKLADPQDAITLQADKDSSTLNILFDNEKSDRATRFKLNLINID